MKDLAIVALKSRITPWVAVVVTVLRDILDALLVGTM